MAIGTTAALIGGTIASSAIGARGAKKAADAQARSADQSVRLQRDIYNETTQRFAPYLEGGGNALDAYLYEMGLGDRPMIGGTAPEIKTVTGGRGAQKYLVGDMSFDSMSAAEAYADERKTGAREYAGYSESPMAKYLLREGMEGIEGGAAAAGGLYSGATLQALENNRREVITADTDNYFARLYGLTGMGLSAAGNQANAGQNYASGASQALTNKGNAQAGGYLGQAQAFQGGINDAAGIYGYFSNPMQAYTAPTLFGGNSWG
jgi:hypothetical protein